MVNGGSSINAEVITFSRMAYRVIKEKGNNLENIEGFGKSMLIYDILDTSKKELTFLGKNLQNIEIVERAITEFKKHNISEEKLKQSVNKIEDRYLKTKLEDLSNIYTKFQNKIEEKFLDESDALTYLAKNLEKSKIFDNSLIYIDEFVGFTPKEYEVIKELMQVSKEVNITICTDNIESDVMQDTDIFYSNKVTMNKLLEIAKQNKIDIGKTVYLDENYRFKSKELAHLEQNIYSNTYRKYQYENEDIKLFLSANPYSEIEHVANKIIENVRENGYRYREIGIITKNIDTYSGLIKAIFSKYDIPVFIDEKKDLSQNILIKYILSILDVFSKNWSYESVISYVKTGFCEINNSEIYKIENYCKKWGIKYSKWYKKDWDFGEEKEKLKELNEIRKKIVTPLLEFKDKCYKNMSGADLSKSIYEFLIENNIDKKLKEKANKNAKLQDEYRASFNTVVKILDEISKIFGKDDISYEKYAAFLKIAFSENALR